MCACVCGCVQRAPVCVFLSWQPVFAHSFSSCQLCRPNQRAGVCCQVVVRPCCQGRHSRIPKDHQDATVGPPRHQSRGRHTIQGKGSWALMPGAGANMAGCRKEEQHLLSTQDTCFQTFTLTHKHTHSQTHLHACVHAPATPAPFPTPSPFFDCFLKPPCHWAVSSRVVLHVWRREPTLRGARGERHAVCAHDCVHV